MVVPESGAVAAGRKTWRDECKSLWQIAGPVILTGVRVSTQVIVGIAAIAAIVGGPGLGTEIFRGLRSLGSPGAANLVYGGTLAVIVLALLFDAFFILVRRLTTSRGIR